MSISILVLVGSPRENGNTEKLADAFIEGALKNGNDVTKINVGKLDIKGCKGCKYCFTHEGTCAIRDDMDLIYPLLKKVDMLVLATPIYFFSMTAQLKAVIDRLNATYKYPMHIKKSALLAVGAAGDYVFEPLISEFKLIITKYQKWEDAGIITVSGVDEKDDILKTGFLEKAKVLGESIK